MDTLPKLNMSELQPWLNKPEMINACVAQVQKDLGMFDIELSYSGQIASAFDELFEQLHPQIEKMLQQGNVGLMDILYRVDVPEKFVKEMLSWDTSLSVSLTKVILLRDLQKVVIRDLLSKQGL
jgi:hypothetical protein